MPIHSPRVHLCNIAVASPAVLSTCVQHNSTHAPWYGSANRATSSVRSTHRQLRGAQLARRSKLHRACNSQIAASRGYAPCMRTGPAADGHIGDGRVRRGVSICALVRRGVHGRVGNRRVPRRRAGAYGCGRHRCLIQTCRTTDFLPVLCTLLCGYTMAYGTLSCPGFAAGCCTHYSNSSAVRQYCA